MERATVEDLAKMCVEIPTECHEPAERELSQFPGLKTRMSLLTKSAKKGIINADKLGISEKRQCFLALRQRKDQIYPSLVFLPVGITVGQLVTSQVIGPEFIRK